MRSETLPRIFLIAAVVAVLGWTAARTILGRPAEPHGAIPSPSLDEPLAKSSSEAVATFAGGCFWGTQAIFQHLKGVTKVTAGYAGGAVDSPYYDLVSSGSTGHAESVQVIYDPSQITYGRLLMVFFGIAHDPTQVDRQGPDVGTQYRSVAFYSNDEQKRILNAYVSQLNGAKIYDKPIATQIVPLKAFYPAEEYHQNYLEKHPDNMYCRVNDVPKISRLKQQFPNLYR